MQPIFIIIGHDNFDRESRVHLATLDGDSAVRIYYQLQKMWARTAQCFTIEKWVDGKKDESYRPSKPETP